MKRCQNLSLDRKRRLKARRREKWIKHLSNMRKGNTRVPKTNPRIARMLGLSRR